MAKIPKPPPRANKSCVAVYIRDTEIPEALAFSFPAGMTTFSGSIIITHLKEKDLDDLEDKFRAFVKKHGGVITIVCQTSTYVFTAGMSSVEPTEGTRMDE